MKRICFVGLYEEFNMGDPVIAHCTEWLFTKDIPDVEIVRLTLDKPDKELRRSFVFRVKNKIRMLLGWKLTNDKLAMKVFPKALKYYRDRIKDCDLVILVGGGLIKYKYQMLGVETAALCEACSLEEKNLIINAVGIESYDGDNMICKMISKALQNNSVKYISTRDDLELLKSSYLKGNTHVVCEKVADPAVWANEAYAISKDQTSKMIGVGIGRAGLFMANDINISGNEIQDLYERIVVELVNRKFTVQLFTNGLLSDNSMAERVKKRLQDRGIQVSLRVPHKDRDLVEILSSYQAVIATRLHSCIISYSLEIPAVGLVWNDKLSFFGENIGRRDNYIKPSDFDESFIVNQMEEAIKKGYDQNQKKIFRDTIIKSVNNLQNQYIQV